MLTCNFFGGRLAEVMQTIASLFHLAYIKKINSKNIVIPLLYRGSDFLNNKTNVFVENYPIFKKISNCFRMDIDIKKFRPCDIACNWGKYYIRDKMEDDVIVSNHWLDFIYNTNIYKKLYYQEDLWNKWKNKYIQLYKNDTIGIHVRRCDFVLLEENREKYKEFMDRKLLPIDNINKCIEDTSLYTNIIIFSDDIEWCKNNIKKQDNVYFMEGNKPYQDLILMSMCDDLMRTHGSTFSKMALSLH